ncbi:ABC transporter permease [Sedimentibacter sp. MB31-C6]|uniref:ABC transporter permease n=1 Tax=Sedimentibacter sp. MB31-C6 TaxID=3109366 RepID=UPI002DDD9B93|nr:ABC transporter permease [Sedimentibacter sp. MB36-C1]WSI05336.1 ABC transporter permease [Sedimentibacter sp. MB36-C1]
MGRRDKSKVILIAILVIIILIMVFGTLITDEMLSPQFEIKNQLPSLEHPFGTDWLGRDMFLRTIKGLRNSLVIGSIASLISCIIALIIGGLAGTMPKWVDFIAKLAIDLVMGIPHIILIILISVLSGRGAKGVLIGVAVTHWTSLARIVRSEVLQVRSNKYVMVSRRFGKNGWYIFKNHMIPIVFPQFIVGLILMFPHAILHEASVTFLGFGLSPESAAIGIILSESMKYLVTGMWHLAFFPGLSLVVLVLLINKLGENLSLLLNPNFARE